MADVLSPWDIADTPITTALDLDTLLAMHETLSLEIQELERDYHTGVHPPDWYDQYVYPLVAAASRIDNAIASKPMEQISQLIETNDVGEYKVRANQHFSLSVILTGTEVLFFTLDPDGDEDFLCGGRLEDWSDSIQPIVAQWLKQTNQ